MAHEQLIAAMRECLTEHTIEIVGTDLIVIMPEKIHVDLNQAQYEQDRNQLKEFLQILIQINLKETQLKAFTAINIEWNDYNGFVVSILGIEYQGKKRGFQSELIGIHVSSDHLIIYFAFIRFDIHSPII